MINGYRFTVSHGGHYLFATEMDSIPTKEKAKEIYELFKKKFPESEGYRVLIMHWEAIDRIVF